MIATTIKQSKTLIGIGLDIKTSDMIYIPFANDPTNYDLTVNIWDWDFSEDWIPSWSLSALMELMPTSFNVKRNSEEIALSIPVIDVETAGKDIFDCVYKMIVWLIMNNKLTNINK